MCSPVDRSPPMTKPISPLRQRMIDDMTMSNLSPSTHETYIRAVAQFSAFHRRSPDKLGVEHLREYHLHLVSRGLTANSLTHIIPGYVQLARTFFRWSVRTLHDLRRTYQFDCVGCRHRQQACQHPYASRGSRWPAHLWCPPRSIRPLNRPERCRSVDRGSQTAAEQGIDVGMPRTVLVRYPASTTTLAFVA